MKRLFLAGKLLKEAVRPVIVTNVIHKNEIVDFKSSFLNIDNVQ